MATVNQWCDKLTELVGVRFHHQGRNRHGVDCYGLMILAAEELGMATPEMYSITGYNRLPGKQLLHTYIGRFLKKRTTSDCSGAKKGDILEFFIDDRTASRHMGVITRIEDRLIYMVHADGRERKVVETRVSGTSWVPRINGIWYYPDFEDD